MPGRGRQQDNDEELTEQRNGLYEKDGEIVEWKNGNEIGPRGNFMVKVIGYYEKGTISGRGYIMEVSVKDYGRNNKWRVTAKATDFQSALSTIRALNKDGRLLVPNASSLKTLLPEYMDRIIRKFLTEDGGKRKDFTVVDIMGNIKLDDERIIHVMPKSDTEVVVFNSKGKQTNEENIFAKIKPAHQERLFDEKKLLKKVLIPLIEITPANNKAHVILTCAWFLSKINYLSDQQDHSTGVNCFLNAFGDPCSVKSSIVKMMMRIFGISKSCKGYSLHELMKQTARSAVPCLADDVQSKSYDTVNHHDIFVGIAEQVPRVRIKSKDDNYEPPPVGAAALVSNLMFSYSRDHVLLSRSLNLFYRLLGTGSKGEFTELMEELLKTIEGKTCYSEGLRLRERYTNGGRRDRGSRMLDEVLERLKQIMNTCNGERALNVYREPLKYAAWVTDYIGMPKLMKHVWSYMETVVVFHRFPIVADTLEQLPKMLQENWQPTTGNASFRDYVLSSFDWGQGSQHLYVNYGAIERIWKEFTSEMRKYENDKIWSNEYRKRHDFFRNGHKSCNHSFKIEASGVPPNLRKFLDDAELNELPDPVVA